jgi:electron transfer flavoprotein alpha subunit
MQIAVCVKQVPIFSRMTFNTQNRTIVREGVPNEINTYDQLAVQVAVDLTQMHGGEVTVMTLGPPQARDVLARCLALGAHHAVHLTDPAFAGSDTLATSQALALALQRHQYDLVLCGKHSTDAETSQVPPQVAELLGLPQVTGVRRLEIDPDGGTLRAERETEEGYEEVEVDLPALVTVAEGITQERRVSRDESRAAGEQPMEALTAGDLSPDSTLFGAAGSPTSVSEITVLDQQREAVIIQEEDPARAVERLVAYLMERGLFTGWPADPRPEESSVTAGARSPDKAIWVLAETDEAGALRPATLELLGKALSLAPRVGGEAAVLLLGHGLEAIPAQLAAHGAHRVYLADHPSLALFDTEAHTAVLAAAVLAHRPYALLVPSTVNGRDVAARLAARLKLGLTGDCINLDIDEEGRLVQYKPAFGGNVVAPILSRTLPQLATVRPGIMAQAPQGPPGEVPIEPLEIPEAAATRRVRVISRHAQEAADATQLYNAAVVVGIGMGIGGPENLPVVQALADVLDASIAATREVVNHGWLPRQFQIGLTGKAIAPKLYIGVGVGGALNHIVGVQRAGTIVGINIREQASIFKACDFGIVGDYAELVPALTQALRQAKEAVAKG